MKFALYIFILFIFLSPLRAQEYKTLPQTQLIGSPNYPRWIQSGEAHTDQTSGITYIGKDTTGAKNFIIVDDIGKINRFNILNDTVFTLINISFYDSVENYLSGFPKKDFEEIFFDKASGKFYLSIEGNKPSPEKYVGIYRIEFENEDVNSNRISSIERLEFKPSETFLKYIDNNIGYEGFTGDENYFYLGLEGFSSNGYFADSTVIFIADKNNLNIIKEINTKSLGIHTICGLFSDNNNSVWGIDRNNRKIFHLTFDENLNLISTELYDVKISIPSYSSLSYVGALESITMDDENNLFLIDDPWKKFFVPQTEILSKLDNKTVDNFKKYIPIIYKFHITERVEH